MPSGPRVPPGEAPYTVTGVATPVRLVATDLDGTFLGTDGTVSARARAAVGLARSAGIYVIPVTARAPWSARVVARDAGMAPLAVCGNGAVLYDLGTGSVIEHTPIGRVVAARVVARVRAALPGVLFAAESVESMVAEQGLFDADAGVLWGLGVLAPVSDVLGGLGSGAPVTKLLCHHPGRPTDPTVVEEVAAACGWEASVTSATPGWVTVGAPGVTKATGLARACERLGVSAAEVLGVGDAPNDLPMLAWVGHPVAVANACVEVLSLAGRVVASNAGDGVARLLECLAGVPAALPA